MTHIEVQPGAPWAEAVFHVLAHVASGVVPASCHDANYVAFAREQLGPAEGRALGEDVRVLERALAGHDRLAHAQALAWLWRDEQEVSAHGAKELDALREADVRDVRALNTALLAGPPVEVLRAAAELELPGVVALSSGAHGPRANVEALQGELAAIAKACPELSGKRISVIRALPWRGRAFGDSILVGTPGIAAATVHHVAWQAAHEGTVLEVVRRHLADPSSYVEVERAALGLLRARAHEEGLADAHAAWLARLDVRALLPIPDFAPRH